MLVLFLAVAVPANLLGVAALVYALRGKSAGVATVLAILTLLAAAMTTSLAVFESAAVRRLEDNARFEADEAEVRRIAASADQSVRTLTVLGFAASALPWLGAILCFVRARRVDD